MAEHSAERRDWSPGPFLAHLNQRHPDTVLFLARHFIGDEQPTDARLVGIKGDQLLIGVTTTGGSRTVPLPLTAAVASRSELVDQMAAMLRAAREARPDEPLTSLEVDISAPHAADGARHDPGHSRQFRHAPGTTAFFIRGRRQAGRLVKSLPIGLVALPSKGRASGCDSDSGQSCRQGRICGDARDCCSSGSRQRGSRCRGS